MSTVVNQLFLGDLFGVANHTELYQLCHSLGLRVPASFSKNQLIQVLSGELEIVQSTSEIDSWRHGIMGFLLDHWDDVVLQLSCPAASGDPLSCFQCTDVHVLACISNSQQYEHLIQLHRK